MQADYTGWLLSKVEEVTAADALRALSAHLTPLFEASAVLVVSSSAGKAKELAESLGEAHISEPLPGVLAEDELSSKLCGGHHSAGQLSDQTNGVGVSPARRVSVLAMCEWPGAANE